MMDDKEVLRAMQKPSLSVPCHTARAELLGNSIVDMVILPRMRVWKK